MPSGDVTSIAGPLCHILGGIRMAAGVAREELTAPRSSGYEPTLLRRSVSVSEVSSVPIAVAFGVVWS